MARIALRRAAAKRLAVVCTTDPREVARLVEGHAALLAEKASCVAILGGAAWDKASATLKPLRFEPFGRLPDALGDAAMVLDFCVRSRVSLVSLSLGAAPEIPISTSGDCAAAGGASWRHVHSLLQYPLQLLWHQCCVGASPPGQTREWYLRTFCGVKAGEERSAEWSLLGASAEMEPHLTGALPCPPVALLVAALPDTRGSVRKARPQAATLAEGGTHYLHGEGSPLPADAVRAEMLAAADACGFLHRDAIADWRQVGTPRNGRATDA